MLRVLKKLSRQRWKQNRRNVSSLGPLASAFNCKQSFSVNVLGGGKKTGLFNVPELDSSHGFAYIKEKCFDTSESLVAEACNPHRERNIAVIFDDLSDELCRVADLADFIRLAHPDESFALAAQDACIDVSALVEKLNTNIGIYSALKESVEQGDKFAETDVDKHVAQLFLQDFHKSGIHLGDRKRREVVELTDRILRTGQKFASNCQIPRAVRSTVLPEEVRGHFHNDGENLIVSGHNLDSPGELTREAAYKIYYWKEAEQEALLADMLNDRFNLAQLCGYETFSHRAQVHSLAETPENIAQFHAHLSQGLVDRVAQDHKALLEMKRKVNPGCKPLAVWDIPYFSAQARANWFKLDLEKISEYFSLGVAMEGLNELYTHIFGVRIEVEKTQNGELWSPDVFKLAVRDDTTLLGHIYCDFFSRPGKPYQDCHFTIRGGREQHDGSYQAPVVVVMLNLSSPGWRTPTLLSPSALDNLFHEMGHAMHSMLGRTKYQHVTGTRCSTDIAEVPSTLMEYFAADPRVLARLNKHYRTGDRLPEDVIGKLCATKKIFASVELQAQLLFSSLDQVYHGVMPMEGDTTAVLEDVHSNFHSLPYVPNTAPQLRFSHLVGYGARYCSYLLAKSVASAIWQQNLQEDPYSREAGMRFREECLSHGGGKRSLQLVCDYLQKDVQPIQLSTALLTELDEKRECVEKLLKGA